jgi:DNA-binding NarL/FixJ family response regulator
VIRVLLVDDHDLLVAGLRALLDQQDGITPIAQASSAEQAIATARSLRPDVILLDLLLPGRHGVDAIPALREACESARVIVVSSLTQPTAVRAALTAGAQGYVRKQSPDSELIAAIRRVAAGQRYVDPDLGAQLVVAHGAPGLDPISERERDVLLLLALGHTNHEVGEKLYVSARTVDSHRAHIMRKLGLQTRAELVHFALVNGLIGPS